MAARGSDEFLPHDTSIQYDDIQPIERLGTLPKCGDTCESILIKFPNLNIAIWMVCLELSPGRFTILESSDSKNDTANVVVDELSRSLETKSNVRACDNGSFASKTNPGRYRRGFVG